MTEDSRYFDEKLGAWVTVCPPGEAFGSDELKRWSTFRLNGGFADLKEKKGKVRDRMRLAAQDKKRGVVRKKRVKRRKQRSKSQG